AVDEAGQIAAVEVTEAVHLVHHQGRVAEHGPQALRQLEIEVVPPGEDVDEEIAARVGRAPRARVDRLERPQPARPPARPEHVPELRPHPDVADESGTSVEGGHPGGQGRRLSNDLADRRPARVRVRDAQDQEEGVRTRLRENARLGLGHDDAPFGMVWGAAILGTRRRPISRIWPRSRREEYPGTPRWLPRIKWCVGYASTQPDGRLGPRSDGRCGPRFP